jgi:glycosyltransferase involved in cell wall biosynthesis
MHIGFDVSQTGSGKAGCGYFADAMIKAMLTLSPQHKYALYPSFGDFYFDPQIPLRNPYRGEHAHYGPRHLTRETAGTFWNQPNLDDALGRPDVVHCNNFWAPTQLSSSRLIYTLYDAGFTVDPDWTTEANRIGCFNGMFQAARRADWVVSISDYSRAHFLKLFPHFPAERVRVVYPCSRFSVSTAKEAAPAALKHLAPQSFWLSVGTIEPRKNQRMLAQAYARYLQAGGAPMPLVLAGGKGWLMDDFQDYVASLDLADHLILTGYVSDEEMIWLYRNCYASLYPSKFEGFGLPVLEGMQFGAATVCSNASSIPEVAGDAAIMLSPEDPDGWTQTLLALASAPEKRYELSLAGPRRAEQFDWERSAETILQIYAEAIASPKRHPNSSASTERKIAEAENQF